MWNNSEDNSKTESSIVSFASAFLINFVIGVLSLLGFSLIRLRFKHVYFSNFLVHSTKRLSELSESQVQTLHRLKLSESFFSWLTPAFRISDEEICDFAGLDIFVYLRFVRLCLKISVAILPYGLLVLVPLNLSGGANLKGMATLTLGNLERKSDKLWAHLVGVWLYSLLLYYLLYKEWEAFTHYRQIYLRKGYEQQYSILVTDLPAKLQNDKSLNEFMDSIFPEKVISAHVVKNLKKWRNLIEEHDDLVWKYEHAQELLKKYKQRPSHKRFQIFGTRFDSITFYENRLKSIHEEIVSEQDQNHAVLSSAIITFSSLQDAAIGLQTSWNSSPAKSFVTPAPAWTDVIWDNITLSDITKSGRYVIVCIALFFLVLFWSTPVIIVASMLSLDALQKQFSFMEGVNNLPRIIQGFIEGFLAALALTIFFSILPKLMALLARFEGINSRSQVAISCIGKLFIFQVFSQRVEAQMRKLDRMGIVNKFFGVLFGGALLSRIHDIADNPTRTIDILAESMPSMATFFMHIIMLRSLMGFPMEILQLFRLLKVSIQRKWFCETVREYNEVWKPPPVRYPGMFANSLFMYIIGVAYSVLAPVVAVFVVIYFGISYIIRFYMLMYVSKSSYQSGGLMWPKVFNRMVIGIFVFQFVMIGVFALKQNALVSLFCLPLPVLTLILYRTIQKRFNCSTRYLNLSLTKEIRTPEKEFLQNSSQKYNRQLFVPEMFALSTDKKATRESSDDEEPSENHRTSKSSLVEFEMVKLNPETSNHEQV